MEPAVFQRPMWLDSPRVPVFGSRRAQIQSHGGLEQVTDLFSHLWTGTRNGILCAFRGL